MLLIGLLIAGGLLMFIAAAAIAVTGGLNFANVVATVPIAFSALALFGIAQVIHALLRAADATEATLRETRAMREGIGMLRGSSTKKCPVCHTENSLTATTCRNCGKAI